MRTTRSGRVGASSGRSKGRVASGGVNSVGGTTLSSPHVLDQLTQVVRRTCPNRSPRQFACRGAVFVEKRSSRRDVSLPTVTVRLALRCRIFATDHAHSFHHLSADASRPPTAHPTPRCWTRAPLPGRPLRPRTNSLRRSVSIWLGTQCGQVIAPSGSSYTVIFGPGRA